MCHYFTQLNNKGNGKVQYYDNINELNDKSRTLYKNSEVEITTLDTFMPYLLNKNISLMKIDIEGHEYQALKRGKKRKRINNKISCSFNCIRIFSSFA